MTNRPLHKIAAEITRDWQKPDYAAIPYLNAMRSMDDINQPYYEDPGKFIVAYFLSNATSWRGETARMVKAELKSMLK